MYFIAKLLTLMQTRTWFLSLMQISMEKRVRLRLVTSTTRDTSWGGGDMGKWLVDGVRQKAQATVGGTKTDPKRLVSRVL